MNRYTIHQATSDVAASLRASDWNDEPMIRTAINDALDAAYKSGLLVNHDYNQRLAVKRVKRLLASRGVGYQPKTGQRCHCKPGQHRDNCPDCEGTGWRIDFAAIRARKTGTNEILIANCPPRS